MNALDHLIAPPVVPLWTGPSKYYAPLMGATPARLSKRPRRRAFLPALVLKKLLRAVAPAALHYKTLTQGSTATESSVANACNRLLKKGKIERPARGVYRIRAEAAA